MHDMRHHMRTRWMEHPGPLAASFVHRLRTGRPATLSSRK